MAAQQPSSVVKLVPHPRQSGLVPSATLAINERRNQLIAEDQDVLNFGLGLSLFPAPKQVTHAAIGRLFDWVLAIP